MDLQAIPCGEDETAQLVAGYLDDAHGDALLALRSAAKDVLRLAVEARLTEIELRRAVSSGYLRRASTEQAA